MKLAQYLYRLTTIFAISWLSLAQHLPDIEALSSAEECLACMTRHRFHVGQTVKLSMGIFHPDRSLTCTIVRLLPFDGICFQYRVKNMREAFERVAKEHELTMDRVDF